MRVAYIGFNSFFTHKRGVENVIDFQSQSYPFTQVYYLHLGDENGMYRYGNFICFSIKKTFLWPLYLNLLLFKLRKRRDVRIHSHTPLISAMSFMRTDILTVHDGLYYQAKASGAQFLLPYYLIEKFAYMRSKKVHFISNFTRSESLFSIKKQNSVIIFNTSNFEKDKKKEVFKNDVLEDKIINVLCVRSIEHRARFDLLLETAPLLSGKIKFTVAGKGPLLEKYRQQVISDNISNIHFLGYVSDSHLLKLYNDADLVLVLAEFGEGFGLPIIEGYLFNKPVIASNVCAIPEVIIDNVFLTPNSSNEIVKKLANLNSLPKLDFEKYYEENFSNEIILKKFNVLYQNMR